jgi:hypothetical protein
MVGMPDWQWCYSLWGNGAIWDLDDGLDGGYFSLQGGVVELLSSAVPIVTKTVVGKRCLARNIARRAGNNSSQ